MKTVSEETETIAVPKKLLREIIERVRRIEKIAKGEEP